MCTHCLITPFDNFYHAKCIKTVFLLQDKTHGFFSFFFSHLQDKYKTEILRNAAQTKDEVEYDIRSDVLQQWRVMRLLSSSAKVPNSNSSARLSQSLLFHSYFYEYYRPLYMIIWLQSYPLSWRRKCPPDLMMLQLVAARKYFSKPLKICVFNIS